MVLVADLAGKSVSIGAVEGLLLIYSGIATDAVGTVTLVVLAQVITAERVLSCSA